MHAIYQAHLRLFDIYDTNGALIVRDWKGRSQSKERILFLVHTTYWHMRKHQKLYCKTHLCDYFNLRVCFFYVWIKTTSSNSTQIFSYVLCLPALIPFSHPFPYLFLLRSLSLIFLWRNDHDLLHLFGTFRVKETTVSEIKGLSQYSSIFPISFQSKRVDDLLIRRTRQNWLHSIHEFQFHRSQKFILSFASSIRLDSLHLLHL